MSNTDVKTEIVNLALTKLGVQLILRLGDATIPASHFGNILYQPTLERVLREFPWSFATRDIQLAELPEPLDVHWDYSYQLPSDNLRILQLLSDHRHLPHDQFYRESNRLHCDVSPARLRYITRSPDPIELDPDFKEAFITLLAAELAKPLLQSPGQAQALKEEYLTVSLPKAKTVDSREQSSNENFDAYRAIFTSPLVRARFSNRTTPFYFFFQDQNR